MTNATLNGVLKHIPIGDLVPHPDNPRVAFREDVVEGITAQLRQSGTFADMHALIVRPKEAKYEVLSGHQRTEGARRAEIAEVPCWVVDMEDAEAHMLLALANSQGELDPLEIGIHALKAVPTGKGGRGKKGGLTAYAELLGKSHQYYTGMKQDQSNSTGAAYRTQGFRK